MTFPFVFRTFDAITTFAGGQHPPPDDHTEVERHSKVRPAAKHHKNRQKHAKAGQSGQRGRRVPEILIGFPKQEPIPEERG